MTTQLHGVFLARVVMEIETRLRTLSTGDCQSRAFAQKIKYDGDDRLIFKSEDNDGRTIIRHNPDAVFRHRDAR